MSTLCPSLPPLWAFYDLHSRQAHCGRVDDFGYGREELLWQILEAIESGTPFGDECRRRLDRVAWNRAKKHRRLRRYLASQRLTYRLETSAVETAESLDQIRTKLSRDEWAIEWRLASGERYADIAGDFGLSPNALKERVYRWRVRVRRAFQIA